MIQDSLRSTLEAKAVLQDTTTGSAGGLLPTTKKEPAEAGSLCWRYLSFRAVTRKVLSAQMSLTSVFGMGTGGPSSQSTPTIRKSISAFRSAAFRRLKYFNELLSLWIKAFASILHSITPKLPCQGLFSSASSRSNPYPLCFDVVTRTGFEPMLKA